MTSKSPTNEFDRVAWREAQEAMGRLLELPAAQRAGAMAAMTLSAAAREKLELMLARLDRPGLLDQPGDACLDVLGDNSKPPRSVPGRDGCPARVGEWRLLEEIGRGGMAVVYRAERAVGDGIQVGAVKITSVGIMAFEGLRRFEQEQAVLARLGHPSITPLIDAGTLADGTPWLVMPLVRGQRIDTWCRQQRLPPREIVRLMLKVCDAVAYAHRHLVVHRDLKPANLLVDDEGHAHLLDFGIARLLDATGEESTRTRWRAMTPQYAAPEQFTGTDTGVSIDVFSLGAMLYDLLTGRPPRGETDPYDTSITRPSAAAGENELLTTEQRQQLRRQMRGDLDRILLKALAPDPEDRYESVSLLAEDLRAWLAHLPVRAARAGGLYRAGKFVRRHRGSVAATALVLIAILAGFAGTLWQAHRAEQSATLARQEAERAQASEARAHSALARSEAMRDFLLGLFRASRPMRPDEEMPTTEDLLTAGVERALRDETADPSLRAEMLSAIAAVYLQRQMMDAAEPLVAQLSGLADGLAESAPETWTRVRLLDAQYAMLRRDFAGAEAILAELNRPDNRLPEDHLLRMETRYEKARMDLIEQRPELARGALEALYREALEREGASHELRMRISNLLGWSLANAGDHQRADEVYATLIDAAALEYGRAHLNYGVHLANAGGNAMRMGAFGRAEALLREAVDVYDRISAEPMPQRATARSLAGMLMLARGDYPGSIAANRASRREWADLQGRARVEDDPVFQYRQAMAEIALERWPSAAERLALALALDWPAGMSSAMARIDVGILLAETECHSGAGQAGSARLEDLRQQIDALPSYDDPRWLAWLEHARAVCLDSAGDTPEALRHMRQAAILSESLPAGFAAEIARRELFHARLLARADQPKQAATVARQARDRLESLELPDHPLMQALSDMLTGEHVPGT